ncbi:DUF7255 family protein [Anditalea andensis]|uniref:Uncharacterized protein n=1 Tax=Anditalea andensis TaxID=1048983 RepID=A0A074LJS5_9BACT|nr:hypothetical protein [Anditalea andensis]KEO74052.1 hypothetical protein EL17_07855 [Anditalea andensis]
MHHSKINKLVNLLLEQDLEVESSFTLDVAPSILDQRASDLMQDVYQKLGGLHQPILLNKVKFDFKIDHYVFVYDNENHFNRYRLSSLKSKVYNTFSFIWKDAYLRLCRTYERDCLKSGMQERIWNGPPIAQKHFGASEEPGDLSGSGAAGWKLNAYNDAQIDLYSRLLGYKLIRIPKYENIMIGGSLKMIDQLLLSPNKGSALGIAAWVKRKCEKL